MLHNEYVSTPKCPKRPDCSLPSLLRFSIWCSKCCCALIICSLKSDVSCFFFFFQFSASCRHWLSVEVNKLVCLRNCTAFAWLSVHGGLCVFVAHPKMPHGSSCPARGWWYWWYTMSSRAEVNAAPRKVGKWFDIVDRTVLHIHFLANIWMEKIDTTHVYRIKIQC